MPPPSSLTFYGAVGEVTGSMHLGFHRGNRWAVDCGLIQGTRKAEAENYAPWPFKPSDLTTLVLTHAHMDHAGRLPKLIRDGFRGVVHCTDATRDLAEILLKDSAKLQTEEAKYRTKIALRRGEDPREDPFNTPLYTMLDVRPAIRRMRPHPLGVWSQIGEGLEVRFHDAGHILGSTHAELRLTGQKTISILYSGDIGRYSVALMRDPAPPPTTDILVMESTYGDRNHPDVDVSAALADAINPALQRGGIVLIPAFAVSRTQSVLWYLAELEQQGRIPSVPVYLDSPMAQETTQLYRKYPDILDPPLRGQGLAMQFPRQYREVVNRDDSKALNARHDPCIIIAASGMLSGGRILHHVAMRAPVRENLILFTGYQAEGTLGRRVLDGAPSIRIFGADIPVRAEVEQISGFSGHADQDELIRWAKGFNPAPRHTFLVHGEREASEALQERLRSELGWKVEIPVTGRAIPISTLL